MGRVSRSRLSMTVRATVCCMAPQGALPLRGSCTRGDDGPHRVDESFRLIDVHRVRRAGDLHDTRMRYELDQTIGGCGEHRVTQFPEKARDRTCDAPQLFDRHFPAARISSRS